ncbi:ATP-binding cassette domain-containing protein [uncultured Shimia sp.]|uniref:ATP-binding cassette domain-containing protein n=1 Tax=uncultured Shimia sp. TaxID=573152 RepID=UPI00260B08A8|nr:ATP-binding cassette domain-containing protein [uncultured Shimia sp.]
MHSDDGALLFVENVSQSFRPAKSGWFGFTPETRPIAHVSLRVAPGEVVGVVGKQAAGKNTLLRTILGLVKPETGRVTFLDQDIATLTRADKRKLRPLMRQVTPQSVAQLDVSQTPSALLREALLEAQVTHSDAQELRTKEALRLVGLDHVVAQSDVEDLSVFQQHLVAIAHAIVTRPSLVVVQDPAQGLDVSVQARLLDLLLKLQDELQLSMVISSTDIVMLGSLCDRLVVLRSGEIVEEGLAQQLLEAPQHEHTQLLVQQARDKEQAA